MDVRSRILGGLARQAGHPGGLVGRLMGVALNLGDRKDVAAAVDALTIPSSGVVADVGFGGGLGLRFLLDRVSGHGNVHGVEVSSVMLSGAARKFSDEIARGCSFRERAAVSPCAPAARPQQAPSQSRRARSDSRGSGTGRSGARRYFGSRALGG